MKLQLLAQTEPCQKMVEIVPGIENFSTLPSSKSNQGCHKGVNNEKDTWFNSKYCKEINSKISINSVQICH